MIVSNKTTRVLWTGAAAALLALAVVVPRVMSSNAQTREIHLVARDMAYYVVGGDEPNPELRVSAGDRVRIRLVNRDPGMTHDFGVAAWNVATGAVGESREAEVEFTVPSGPADVRYACTPHGEMMHGTIHVE